MNRRPLRQRLLLSTGLAGVVGFAGSTAAQEAQTTVNTETDSRQDRVVEMQTTGRRYGLTRSSTSRIDLPLLDLPRTVTMIDDALLQEQGRRTLRDSLRNVTGISMDAGEGNPPGGTDQIIIRGFSASGDIYVDGIRDVGLFFRDPFDVEHIEVAKGPGSAELGRGNVGGSINLVSRTATQGSHLEGETSVGNAGLRRSTLDVNQTLSEEQGIAVRLNMLYHEQDIPGRDVVNNQRWALSPSIAWGLGSDTEVTLSYYHQRQDDLPDGGLPNARSPGLVGTGFSGRPAPLPRNSFLGHDNDYQLVRVDRYTLKVDHHFSPTLRMQSRLRHAATEVDQNISRPTIPGAATTLDENTLITAVQKPRKQRDSILVGRNDLMWDVMTGEIEHRLLFGVEASQEKTRNLRRLDTAGPPTSLFNPQRRVAPLLEYNGTVAQTQTDVLAAYVFDTVEITPKWIASGGIRYDYVTSRVQGIDNSGQYPDFEVDLSKRDSEFSTNIGLTYKPVENASIFAAWGTSFQNNARVELMRLASSNNTPPITADRFFVGPERTESIELGAKWESRDGALSLASAVFETRKLDARTPGVDPEDPPIVLDGEQRVRGFEASAVGALTEAWNVFVGYTYLDGIVSKSNLPSEQGQVLPQTPRHSFTLWTSYLISPYLNVGGGFQHISARKSNLQTSPDGPFSPDLEAILANPAYYIATSAPSFTVFDLFAEYSVNQHLSMRLNLDNIGNKYYFESTTNRTSIPGQGRAVRLSATYNF